MKKIFIICGELSGEGHAARVLYELLKLEPELKVRAMGSSILSEMGAKIVIDYQNYSYSGFTEVVKNLPKILKLKEVIVKEIIEFNPDLVLGVDYSGLNLEIAATLRKRLKDKRPKFVQYIAPQLWASRPYRINKVKANVDKILCTLPFEENIYRRHNVPVSYIGNPVISSLSPAITKAEFLQSFAKSTNKDNDTEHYTDENQLLIGIFPGSRKSEIRHLLPQFVEAARRLKEKIPNSRFILAKAPTISTSVLFESGLNDNTDHQGNTLIELLEPKMMFNANHKLMSAADCLWLCSGTATLEASLYAKPHFLTYKGDKLSYLMYRIFRTIDMAGLANIIARKYIVQEFLQDEAKAENFLNETYAWLNQEYLEQPNTLEFSPYYKEIHRELKGIKTILGSQNTQKLAAAEIITLL